MVDKVVVVYNIAVSPSYTVYCIWSNRTQCHHQLAISTIFLLASKLCCLGTTSIRGGVEDTRLEAKAKDTKKTEAKAKDSLSEDRHSRGQGQECSRLRPRTQAQVLSKITKFFRRSQKKKKKGLHKNFSSGLHKKTFSKIFFKRFTKF